ncbi:MAG: ankyrin repeat domain-containing protein, partial [Parachlamydia sp.]|nr:ankyrin repeat domain-containing protein [Parachlamydia sp.]
MSNLINGFSTKRPDGINWSQLIHARNVGQVRHLAGSKSLPGIDQQMSDGVYPLHAAIRLGDVEMAKELMKQKADPSLRDHQNLSAYDYAILSEKKELMELLFSQEAGKALEQALAKTNHTLSESRKIQSQVVQLEGHLRQLMATHSASLPPLTGLHQVLAEGNVAALKLMESADLSQNNHSHHMTPLHLAVLSRNEEMVKEVLRRVSDKECLAKDSYGMTPMHYAAMYGLAGSLDEMLKRVKKEFHIDAIDSRQQHSLANLAVVAQQPKALAVLCQHGVNLDFASKSGCSATHLLA